MVKGRFMTQTGHSALIDISPLSHRITLATCIWEGTVSMADGVTAIRGATAP